MLAMSALMKWLPALASVWLLASCSIVPPDYQDSRFAPNDFTFPPPATNAPREPLPVVVVPPPVVIPPTPVVPTNPPAPPALVSLPKPTPPPPRFELPPAEWVSVLDVARFLGTGPPVETPDTNSPNYAFTGAKGRFTVNADRGQAEWNGINITLGFHPRLVEGQTYLNALEVRKTLDPLFAPTWPSHQIKILVLDPGHGGPTNTGARSILDQSFEKEYTLDWAKRAKPLLERQGWTVFLTRTQDVELSLAERVAFADRVHADLFVSLHFNSRTLPAPADHGGVETYFTTPTGMPSNLILYPPDDTTMNYPNNAFDSENLQLAVRLHEAVLRATGQRDRGVKRARFMGVLRGQTRPAVLVEAAYLSDPKEAILIQAAEYRQRLAEALANGLAPLQAQCCEAAQ